MEGLSVSKTVRFVRHSGAAVAENFGTATGDKLGLPRRQMLWVTEAGMAREQGLRSGNMLPLHIQAWETIQKTQN